MLDEVRKYVEVGEEDLKNQVILKKKDSVFFLLLNKKANSFDKTFIRQINQALDEVEQNEGEKCVITISLQKIFSAGIDLKFAQTMKHPDDRKYLVL